MRPPRSTITRLPVWQRITAGIEGFCGLGLVVIALLLLLDGSAALRTSSGLGLLGLGILASVAGQLVPHRRRWALGWYSIAVLLLLAALVCLSPF